tara:strand:+ start:183 stop:476 length:294 start_codon:yes stop_codon:yes gene_type:complete
MIKYSKFLILFIFLQGCTETSTLVSSGFSIATGTHPTKIVLSTVSDLYLERITGKNSIEHAAGIIPGTDIRKCEIIHSADINEVFFDSLDEIDCIKS